MDQGKRLCYKGGQAESGDFKEGVQDGSVQGGVKPEGTRSKDMGAMMSKDGADQGRHWTKVSEAYPL